MLMQFFRQHGRYLRTKSRTIGLLASAKNTSCSSFYVHVGVAVGLMFLQSHFYTNEQALWGSAKINDKQRKGN